MLNSGHDITCQVCNILIEYRRTDENKEDTIRDHYLNLHSGDIFCNPKETVRLFFHYSSLFYTTLNEVT